MDPSALTALRNQLIPKATLLTPNLREAAILGNMTVETPDQMKEAAKRIADLGVPSILIKGGHLNGDPLDILLHQGAFTEFPAPRIKTKHTHGTGCTYSAAITAFLARGLSIPDAVEQAKRFIQQAIATAPGLGSGNGPLNHWAESDSSL
jgi:hydroxymethylpyrimidine kinase/phosphomethylpyrimidine kinase